MKRLNLHVIFILLLTTFMSCEESIPRNRPIFGVNDSSAKAVPEEEEKEEEKKEESRPSGAVVIQSNQCACSAGKAVSVGNCASICSDKSDAGVETRFLFFDVALTAKIAESPILKDMLGFCSTQEGELTNASCALEVKNQSGVIEFNIPITPTAGQTSFKLDVSALRENETYRLTVVELGSKARSTTVQLRIDKNIITDTIGGPLSLMPVSQYSCLFRNGSFDDTTGELFLTSENRFHFYFIPETRPEPLKASTLPTVNCYDIEKFGTNPINSPLFEETTGAFTVWNKSDPRFFDLDDNNSLQIHDLLVQNMELKGQTVSDPESFQLFFPLEWPSGFDDGDTNPADQGGSSNLTVSKTSLGFFMAPFLDDKTFKAYCPQKEHYFSSNILFQAMREIVAVDTEGLFVAKQDNVCDFLLVRESLVKSIWFFDEGGQKIKPTDDTIAGKKVQFYWPADIASPFIKKSHQRTYTIKSKDEFSCNATNVDTSNGIRTNFPPHDKRIGCIPVLTN